MFDIRLRSPANPAREGTVVTGEIDGIRERRHSELVHHKKRPGQTRCLICHAKGPFVWHQGKDNHEVHPIRCS